jgi:Fe-S-cluster containining protein
MPTVCRRVCCKIDAEITPIEVEYIATNTDHVVNKGKAKLGTYCPLLDTTTATCTIYDLRPFNCRAFAVFNSPEYCKTGDSQFSTGSPVKWAAPSITELQQELLSLNNITDMQTAIEQIKDIRWYFKRGTSE